MSDIHYDVSRLGGYGGGYGCGDGFGGGGLASGILLAALLGRGGFGGFGFGNHGFDGHGRGHDNCCDARVDAVRAEAAIIASGAQNAANITQALNTDFGELSEQLCDIRTSEAETRNLVSQTALTQQIAFNERFAGVSAQIGAGNQAILDAIKQTEIDSLRDRLARSEEAHHQTQQTQVVVNAVAQANATAVASNRDLLDRLSILFSQHAAANNRTVQFGTGNVATPTNSATNVAG